MSIFTNQSEMDRFDRQIEMQLETVWAKVEEGMLWKEFMRLDITRLMVSKPNYGITLVDQHGNKHNFDQKTYGDDYMTFYRLKYMQLNREYSMEIMREFESTRKKSFVERLNFGNEINRSN